MTYFAVQHLLAGSLGNVEFKVLSELVAFPEGQSFGSLLVVAIGDKGVARSQCFGHVACQRGEEFIASGGCSSNYNRAKGVFCDVSVSDVANEPDHADNFAASIAMRSKRARLPDVMAIRRMR